MTVIITMLVAVVVVLLYPRVIRPALVAVGVVR